MSASMKWEGSWDCGVGVVKCGLRSVGCRDEGGGQTFSLLEDTLNSAGAA